MTDQELIDGIVVMTIAVGTNYTETQLNDVLTAKSSQELSEIHARAKKLHDYKFAPKQQQQDDTGS